MRKLQIKNFPGKRIYTSSNIGRWCLSKTHNLLGIIEEITGDLSLVGKLNGTVTKLEETSVSKALLKFAHEKHITKLVIWHPKRTKLQRLFRGSTTNKFIEQSKDIQIIVVPYDSI